MSTIHVCKDTSEAVELCESRGLYLKPLARLNVCVQLPIMKTPGKSISSWEVMEKLRKMIVPDEFTSLKVIKTTLEFIRFEGEVENKMILKVVLSRIESHSTMKLSGFTEALKVKSAEAKLVFPSRYDWDSFFRDAKNMNEMKPGERPDTVFFQNLPTKWFSDKYHDPDRPSQKILKQVFETFGEVRCCDIPMLDHYHKDMNKAVGGIQTFSFNQDMTFEAYVQFKEYVGFVKAMDALRGMKLVHKSSDGKMHIAIMKVDFDKTKHLSDKNIQKRRLEREKLLNLEKIKEERVHKEREEEEEKKETSRRRLVDEERERKKRKEEKMRRRKEREKSRDEKRRTKLLAKEKIFQQALTERKTLLRDRRLQSTNLLQELFKMVRASEVERQKFEIEEERKKQQQLHEKQEKAKQEKLKKKEQMLRERLLLNLRSREEKRTEELREKLRKELSGNVLKSVLVSTPKVKKLPMTNGSTDCVFNKFSNRKFVKILKPYFPKPYHRHDK